MTEWPPKDFAKRARDGTWTHESTIDAAQDEIEFLHARIARLQSALATARRALEALKPFAHLYEAEWLRSQHDDDLLEVPASFLKDALDIVSALLSQSVEVGPRDARGTDSSEHFRALAQAFDATDDKDWDHLFLMIPASGHGQFWKRVFNVVRKNLARIRQQESHCLQQHDHRAPAVGDKAGSHPITAERSEAALSQSVEVGRPSGGEWQQIETAPKDGRFLLLHVPRGLESGAVTVGAYWKPDERAENGRFKRGNWDGWLGMDADIMSSWCEPTHWQPLPAPPSPAERSEAAPQLLSQSGKEKDSEGRAARGDGEV